MMKWNPRSVVIPLVSVLLLSACGQTGPVRNARLELAAEHSHSAQRAFGRGDYGVARRQYEMALRIDVSVENVNGIAMDMLNLARVNQALRDIDTAQAYLDTLLKDEALQYPAQYLAAAATQKALLLLQSGDVANVRSWLDRAEKWCESACELGSAIDNARAALALREKDVDRALQRAGRAASSSRGEHPLEYANALRYMSEARLMRGEFKLSLQLSAEALEVDKSLGLPEKIKQDLLLSARACEGMKDVEQAERFRARASRIASR